MPQYFADIVLRNRDLEVLRKFGEVGLQHDFVLIANLVKCEAKLFCLHVLWAVVPKQLLHIIHLFLRDFVVLLHRSVACQVSAVFLELRLISDFHFEFCWHEGLEVDVARVVCRAAFSQRLQQATHAPLRRFLNHAIVLRPRVLIYIWYWLTRWETVGNGIYIRRLKLIPILCQFFCFTPRASLISLLFAWTPGIITVLLRCTTPHVAFALTVSLRPHTLLTPIS